MIFRDALQKINIIIHHPPSTIHHPPSFRSIHRGPSGFEYIEEEFDATQEAQNSTENTRSAKRRQEGGRRRRQEEEEEKEKSSQTLDDERVMSVSRF